MPGRTHMISVRLTDAECRKLSQICAVSGLPVSAAVREMIGGVTIRQRPPQKLHDLYVEINHIGNNINQIARAVNARSFATKEDIIGQAYTYDSFLMLLRRNGYEVRRSPNRKYTTVKPPGAKRAIRLDSLGEGYTEADIMARLSKQRHSGMTPPICIVQ